MIRACVALLAVVLVVVLGLAVIGCGPTPTASEDKMDKGKMNKMDHDKMEKMDHDKMDKDKMGKK